MNIVLTLNKNNCVSFSSVASLFDGECGPWKALSMFLLLVGAATGLGLLFRAWPADLKLLKLAEEAATSRLSDPAFLSSMYEQLSDISRVLMNIKDANIDSKDE